MPSPTRRCARSAQRFVSNQIAGRGNRLQRTRCHTPSQVGRYFKIKERKTSFTTELRAGTVTFLTVGVIARQLAGALAGDGHWQGGLAGCAQVQA
jgi:hypothetical protein